MSWSYFTVNDLFAEIFRIWQPWRCTSKASCIRGLTPTVNLWTSDSSVRETGAFPVLACAMSMAFQKDSFANPLRPLLTFWFLSCTIFLICVTASPLTPRPCSIGFLDEGIPDEELESDDLLPLLQSIRFLKARYTHLDNQEGYFYEALRFLLSCQFVTM